MQATIRVPHVRDSFTVANVGGVTKVDGAPNMGGATIPLREAR